MGGYGGWYGGGSGCGGSNPQWGGIGILVLTYGSTKKSTDIAMVG
jgi:hypothetical protein